MGVPMADVEKKMAAALAAVSTYMQQEEEAVQQQLGGPAIVSQPPPADLNLWGLAGRQDMMSMRQLIQMKAFSCF